MVFFLYLNEDIKIVRQIRRIKWRVWIVQIFSVFSFNVSIQNLSIHVSFGSFMPVTSCFRLKKKLYTEMLASDAFICCCTNLKFKFSLTQTPKAKKKYLFYRAAKCFRCSFSLSQFMM